MINIVVMWLTPISFFLEHLVVMSLSIGRKYSDFIADVMGWCGNSEFISHLSASFVCISYTRFYPVWRGLMVKLSVLRTDCRATAAAAVSF